MFQADPDLFLSAREDFAEAVKLINEAKASILNYTGTTSGSYKKIENNVRKCDLEPLNTLINNTMIYLCQDPEFNETYQELLNQKLNSFGSVDISSLSDEDRELYNLITDQQQRLLLAQLEEYDRQGLLDEEGKKYLEIQRLVVTNLDAQVIMNGLATTDQQYVDMYKEAAERNRRLIELNPNLTEEEKKTTLAEYDKNVEYTTDVLQMGHDIDVKADELKGLEAGSDAYYNKHNELINLQNQLYDMQINHYNSIENLNPKDAEVLEYLKNAKAQNNDYKELNNLYLAGDTDGAAAKKVEMGIATQQEQDLVEYNNMGWWEQRWEDTKTIGCTVYTSLAGVGEALIDGTVMLTAGTVGMFNEDVAKWTEEFTSVNYANTVYDSFVADGILNSTSAYSAVHDVTNFGVTTAAYVCISWIPGAGGTAVMAVAGGGSAAQTAFDNGATFKEAWGSTVINAGLSAVADVGMNKVNALKLDNVNSAALRQFIKTGARTVIGMGEPALNMLSEYTLYGHEKSDGLWDYGVTSGGFLNMAIGFGVANAGGLLKDWSNSKVQTNVDPEFKKKTNGMVSFDQKKVLDFCTEKGITIDELCTMTQTKSPDLDSKKLSIVQEFRNMLTADVMDGDHLKTGTRVAKVIDPDTFDNYCVEGASATVGGSIGLARDTCAVLPAGGQRVAEKLGLNYANNPYLSFDSNTGSYYIMIGDVDGKNTIGIPNRTVDANDVLDPYLGTGFTLDQNVASTFGLGDSFGVPEFGTHGGRSNISNGLILKYDPAINGFYEVAKIDKFGKIHHS